MSPTSYQTAPPRVVGNRGYHRPGGSVTPGQGRGSSLGRTERHAGRHGGRRRARGGWFLCLGLRGCRSGAGRGRLELLDHALEGRFVVAVGGEVTGLQVSLRLLEILVGLGDQVLDGSAHRRGGTGRLGGS